MIEVRLRFWQAKVLAVILAILMVDPGWGATPTYLPQLPDPGSTGMTKEQQEQIGRQAMAEVYKQMPVLPDSSPETQYVRQLGKKLVAVIPNEHTWPYEFHVIPQKEINAFALPGGPMFVNVGAIVAADSEAQLAGVMAHEMSHVYMQHSAKQASKTRWANMLGALGGLFGGGVGSLARLGIQIGAGTFLMRYSRQDEAQADAVGAIIMYRAGYDPKSLADFFLKIEKEGGGNGPQFLSDHPNPGNRQAAIAKEIRNWPPRNYVRDSDAFVQIKQHAGNLRTYTSQQIADGAKEGSWAQQNKQGGSTAAVEPVGALANVTFQQIRPSGNLIPWRNGAFSVSYPENWQANAGEQSTVTIAPQAGAANGALAYGVIVGAVQDQGANSLEQATEGLIQSLQRSNPGMRVSGERQSIQVGEQQGQSVNLASTSPVQQNGRVLSERDWLVTVPDPRGNLVYLLFIAPENDFGELKYTYQKMLSSFQLIGQ